VRGEVIRGKITGSGSRCSSACWLVRSFLGTRGSGAARIELISLCSWNCRRYCLWLVSGSGYGKPRYAERIRVTWVYPGSPDLQRELAVWVGSGRQKDFRREATQRRSVSCASWSCFPAQPYSRVCLQLMPPRGERSYSLLAHRYPKRCPNGCAPEWPECPSLSPVSLKEYHRKGSPTRCAVSRELSVAENKSAWLRSVRVVIPR